MPSTPDAAPGSSARTTAIAANPPSTPPRPAYRPEIDGLRAIAVMAVILNHAGAPWLPGGFLGVDLFFVISGYLITGILHADLAEGNFSIGRFYERRVRRILPALMLVMLLTIPPALILLLPNELENFGQSLVATTLFANNILLLVTSGYFGIEANFRPLLHTWSLGVEEQYYLLVPLLMLAAWRIGKTRGVAVGIAAVTALSLLYCFWASRHDGRADFFLIFSRGWELGAGSLAMLAEPRLRGAVHRHGAAALAAAGLALAVLPLFLTKPGAIPGPATLWPVAGICLVLLFGNARDAIGRVLASAPMVGIGLISYSAYLFHYPIFAFTRLASLEPPRLSLMLLLIGPILLCAWLSWRFVEQPFRDRRRVSTRKVLVVCGTASAITISIGLLFHFTSGFYRNWTELADGTQNQPNANIAYNLAPQRFLNAELPQSFGHPRVLVIGNSFARDVVNMGLETGNFDPRALTLAEMRQCGRTPPQPLANISRADFIIISTRFDAHHAQCLLRQVRKLREVSSAPIVVIGRKSFGWNNNAVMLLPESVRYTWRVQPLAEAVAANEAAKRALPPEAFVDMLAMIADAQGRVPVFTPDRKFISQDREHLTRAGARYLGPIVFSHPALAPLAAAKE